MFTKQLNYGDRGERFTAMPMGTASEYFFMSGGYKIKKQRVNMGTDRSTKCDREAGIKLEDGPERDRGA